MSLGGSHVASGHCIPWRSPFLGTDAPWAALEGFPGGAPANAGDIRDPGSIPGWGRSPGGGHGNPLQYSFLENLMDRGAWQATVHRVAQSRTRLKRLSSHALVLWPVQPGAILSTLHLNPLRQVLVQSQFYRRQFWDSKKSPQLSLQDHRVSSDSK